jgi:cell division protein FtsB
MDADTMSAATYAQDQDRARLAELDRTVKRLVADVATLSARVQALEAIAKPDKGKV